ncbi:type II secretion system protein N [Hyphomonas pacifica]|uniref:Type II secretion system protein GspC N-terminal domain-containing protein n=2 Tax=Hyphomonas pacifica TaxID=1280941 RepID=A0A062U2R6_9PROT|nr:type II secretion system protein N [Hyphomonas pacifica]KCZ50450.1 hypothetical protein HY2_13635 [Hyphomonas pacifica]RAN33886.1 hypothetical protein HY3_12005 [Hyphomonas pacifica]
MDEHLENVKGMARRAAGPTLRIAETGLVIGLGLMCARLVWLVVDPGGAVSPDIPVRAAAAPAGTTAVSLDADTARLMRENPFGSGMTNIADIPDAPETSLNLKLRGVRASTKEDDGIALITTPDNRTSAYTPGDAILDGVVLHRIYGDRVTLRKGGQTETLIMVGGAGLLSVLTVPGEQVPADARASGGASAQIARADLISSLTIDPVHREGTFIGYRIGSRNDSSVLTSAGLQAGDVVVGLNGGPITDMPPAELAKKFSQPEALRLRIDRDGRIIEQTLVPEEAR